MKNNKNNKDEVFIEKIDMRQIETVEVSSDDNLNFIKEDINFDEMPLLDREFYEYRKKQIALISVTAVLIIAIIASMLFVLKGKIFKEVQPQEQLPVQMTRDLVVTTVDNKMLIRSKWGSVYDLAYEADFGEKAECGFKIKDIVYLDKLTDRTVLPQKTYRFVNISSSINPISFIKNSAEKIGPQSGWNYAIKVKKSNHSLTEKDIGSVYKDNKNRKFTIVQIIDEDTYVIFPSSADLSKDKYEFKMPDSNLHYVSGYKRLDTLAWSNIEQTKLTPSVCNLTTSFLADDEKADVNQRNYFVCANFKVKISFDILNITSAIKYLETNAGLNRNSSISDKEVGGKYMSVSYTYVFTSNAACTILNDIECFTDMQISKLYATAFPIFSQKRVYIPNTKQYQDITKLPDKSFEFTKNLWGNENKSPNRIYMFGKDDNSRGICTGCLTDISNINSAFTYDSKHNLIIPNSISKPVSITSGKKYQFVNFIVPFEKNSKFFQETDLTSMCWFFVDSDIYLLVDTHKPVNLTLSLPDYMNTMNVENYDLSNGVSVNSLTVENNSISFKSDYNYGYAVLKLTRQ